MKVNYKYTTIILSVLVITLTSVVAVLAATGTTDSPAAPGSTNSYTLEDIYDRLDSGAAGSQSTFTEPSVAPGTGTMHDLNDIMSKAPALDNTNGATSTHVLAGQTFWGLTASQWATQTGTMPNNGAGSTIVPTTTNQSVAAGYWSSANTVQGDSDLVAGNIAQGVNLFGVDGSGILASGDATPGQVLNGITFSNSSGAATGTMPNNGAGSTIVPTTTNQSVASGYWSSANTVEGDSDLLAENIKCGVTIFGVSGTILPECVAQTGQTTVYSSGDDGEYQKGCLPVVSPSYGSSFGGYNRTSFACTDGFTDNGDGTVTDLLTGLIWLKDADCLWGNWSTALTYVSNLNSGTDYSCGDYTAGTYNDWRLPNINELRSLFDPGLSAPYLPAGHPFTDVQSNLYWSSTTYAPYPNGAWVVNLGNGGVGFTNKAYAYYVWPGRGGQ